MTITPERALADADRIEKMSETERHRAPMFGVPYSIKDLNWTKDIPTSMGSKNYENFMPPADDEIVIRMRNAGGILLGKTTTPEFGGRPTTEGGLCPPARNPWNLEHTAGGSSGGAGSALAAGLGPLAQGSDGGGSIRIPSACCGVVGIKPSRGRISMSPVAGEAWAGFATFGPMARSVRDVATMLDVMHGPVVGDPYWAPEPVTSFKAAVEIPPRHLRIGMISKTSLAKVDSETLAALDSAAKLFEEMGHRVEPISCDPGGRMRDIVMALICAGVGVDAGQGHQPGRSGGARAVGGRAENHGRRVHHERHADAQHVARDCAGARALRRGHLARHEPAGGEDSARCRRIRANTWTSCPNGFRSRSRSTRRDSRRSRCPTDSASQGCRSRCKSSVVRPTR